MPLKCLVLALRGKQLIVLYAPKDTSTHAKHYTHLYFCCSIEKRYMAPECLSNRAYNLKADVYSFSIILWEILTAKTPYLFVRRRHQLINYVVEENGRPDIEESWPSSIQGMLESSFDSEIEKRPVSQLLFVFGLSTNHIHILTCALLYQENDIVV